MYDDTIRLLNTQKGKFREIADDTGLDYAWLHQVAKGVIQDPGVKKIETLNAHLLEITDHV